MAIELAAEIQKRYGFVRRARGCYLYTEKNVRLTDCFLDGGRALLGWDGGKARTVFKDTLERGANGSYCGGYESRLATAVRHLLRPNTVKSAGTMPIVAKLAQFPAALLGARVTPLLARVRAGLVCAMLFCGDRGSTFARRQNQSPRATPK